MRAALLLLAALPALAQPRLLLNQDDLDRIHKIAAAEPWAAAVVNGIVRAAEDWPAAHVRTYGLSEWAVPAQGGGWEHAYVCPEHGVRLAQKAGKNVCPIDGKDYHGWPVDNIVFTMRHNDNAVAARNLGLAYRFTGRAEFAAKARRIFSAYAEIYPTLEIHDTGNHPNTKTGARATSQTLDESVWLISMAFAYDLVREQMPAGERERFETSVLRNDAAVIARNDAGKSNWQSWHNGALLAAGLALDDRKLVDLALDGPGGFKFQMRASVMPDGPWFEGAWGYHFYALQPLLMTREMAARAGIPLPESDTLKRMLDAPLRCVFPDGSLPDFNDSHDGSLKGEARLYEMGYRMFGDARYSVAFQGARRGLESLLWGAPTLPKGDPPALASELLPESGVATLRVRNSDHTLAIKFGPHGGGHGHFDKLSFVSYAFGEHQAADPGTQPYGAPTHATWDKTTVAHNTLVVDEKTQAAATGELKEWTALPDAAAIRLLAGPAYAGVELERALLHTAEYTLDISTARSLDGKPHRFDWVYHNFGEAPAALPTAATLPKTEGYRHLTHATASVTSETWTATFTQAHSHLRVSALAAPDAEVVTGQGLGPDLRVPVPFVMARRQGTEARFVSLLEPYKDAPTVRAFREEAGGIVIEMANATDRITLEAGKLAALRTVAGEPARLILGANVAHPLVRGTLAVPVEIVWLDGGKSLDIYTSGASAGKLIVRAPSAETARVNGKSATFAREGGFATVDLR